MPEIVNGDAPDPMSPPAENTASLQPHSSEDEPLVSGLEPPRDQRITQVQKPPLHPQVHTNTLGHEKRQKRYFNGDLVPLQFTNVTSKPRLVLIIIGGCVQGSCREG